MGASRSDKVLLWEVPLPHLAAFSLPKFLRALKQHPEHGHKIAKRVNSGFPQPPCLCSRDSRETQRFSLLASHALPAPKRRWGPRLGPHHSGNVTQAIAGPSPPRGFAPPKQGAASDNPHQALALLLLRVRVFLAAGSLGLGNGK